ncbi:protein TIFY 10A-like isoform X2 [Henckelia pumila]|uniref:protein TIFY 10A-like isoform X2 n=1 Tax=Henckelia pumila TaxID=405737 RepID=UPI003C6DCD86
MGSPEILDSGKRFNFSQTCSLLSQFLKEGGTFGDQLGRSLLFSADHKGIPTRTMDLLPMIEKSGQNSVAAAKPDSFPFFPVGREETLNKSELSGMKTGNHQSAQMTIFYAGEVIVFDDLPQEKANQIMMLASTAALSPPNTAHRAAESAASFPKFTSARNLNRTPHQLLASDLPIKRKNSLARFLEKRKDRIVATEPYQAIRKPAKREAWLEMELASRSSSPNNQRH